MLQELKNSYGHLFENELLEEIAKASSYHQVPSNTLLIDLGQYIKSIPLLISGAIKVFKEDNNGSELLLYFLEKGETCAMTMNCCLAVKKSEIRAITETDTRLIMVPVEKMEEWTGKYKSWSRFVFDSYHHRLTEMLSTIESLAFENMDQRLINYLKEKSRINNTKIIKNTHQEIAYDLHSSRVVISRLLKKLENLGKVELQRNAIEIISL